MNGALFVKDAEKLVLCFLSCVCSSGEGGCVRTPAKKRSRTPRWRLSALQWRAIAQSWYIVDACLCTAQLSSDGCLLLAGTERHLYYRQANLFQGRGQSGVRAAIARACAWLHLARKLPLGETTRRAANVFTHPWQTLASLRGATPAAPCYTRELLGITAAPKSILIGPIAFDLSYGLTPSTSAPVTANGATSDVGENMAHVDGADARCSMTGMMYGMNGVALSCQLASYATRFRPLSAARSGDAAHVLVFVEKECTLRTLLDSEHALQHAGHALAHRQYIFVCTRGYPCVAARQFVRRLHAEWPTLPMLALVDGDPHGICIALTMMGLVGHPMTCAERPTRSCDGCEMMCTRDAGSVVPLCYVGLRPSLLAAREPAAVSGMSVLTSRDVALAVRLDTCLQTAITFTRTAQMTQFASSLCDMRKELRWMRRVGRKCELQYSKQHCKLLSLIEDYFQVEA